MGEQELTSGSLLLADIAHIAEILIGAAQQVAFQARRLAQVVAAILCMEGLAVDIAEPEQAYLEVMAERLALVEQAEMELLLEEAEALGLLADRALVASFVSGE